MHDSLTGARDTPRKRSSVRLNITVRLDEGSNDARVIPPVSFGGRASQCVRCRSGSRRHAMGEVFPLIDGPDEERARTAGRSARSVRADRSGGVLPGEGRVDPGGEEGLPRLRRPGRVPGVRADERRAVRHLGRPVRARAPPAEEERRLGDRAPDGPPVGSVPAMPTPPCPRAERRRADRRGHRDRRGGRPPRRPVDPRPADRAGRPDPAARRRRGGRHQRPGDRRQPTGRWPRCGLARRRRGRRPARRAPGSARRSQRRPRAAPAGRPTRGRLWLLHDDCAPAPDALEQLLAEVGPSTRRSRSPARRCSGSATAGCCSRSASPSPAAAARETGLERREQDQGQHDGIRAGARRRHRRDAGAPRRVGRARRPRPLAAAASATTSTWAGGPTWPATGWSSSPDAVVHHAEAGGHRRRAGARGRRPAAPAGPAARAATCCSPTCRCSGWSLSLPCADRRHPAAGAGPARSASARRTPPTRRAGAAGRRRPARPAAAGPAGPPADPARCRPGRRCRCWRRAAPGCGTRMEGLSVFLGTREGLAGAGRHRAVQATGTAETGPTSEEADDLPVRRAGWLRRTSCAPRCCWPSCLVALALVAARGLLGDGRLMGGALLPAPDQRQRPVADLHRLPGTRSGSAATPRHRPTSRRWPRWPRCCSAAPSARSTSCCSPRSRWPASRRTSRCAGWCGRCRCGSGAPVDLCAAAAAARAPSPTGRLGHRAAGRAAAAGRAHAGARLRPGRAAAELAGLLGRRPAGRRHRRLRADELGAGPVAVLVVAATGASRAGPAAGRLRPGPGGRRGAAGAAAAVAAGAGRPAADAAGRGRPARPRPVRPRTSTAWTCCCCTPAARGCRRSRWPPVWCSPRSPGCCGRPAAGSCSRLAGGARLPGRRGRAGPDHPHVQHPGAARPRVAGAAGAGRGRRAGDGRGGRRRGGPGPGGRVQLRLAAADGAGGARAGRR